MLSRAVGFHLLGASLLLGCGDDVAASGSAGATAASTSGTSSTTTSGGTPTTGASTTGASEGSMSDSDTAAPTTSTTTSGTTGASSTTGDETTDAVSTTTGTSSTTGDETAGETSTGAGSTTSTTGGPVCGDGVVDDGEDCDEGGDNGAVGSCCSEACELLVGVVCRPGSGDMCDPDELCDGMSTVCPPDVVSEAGTVCGPAPDDICVAPPRCSGVAGEACGDPEVDDELVCAVASGCSPALTCGAAEGQCTCALPPVEGPLTVLIIQSSDVNAGHDMDASWLARVTALGHDAQIVPVSTLNTQNFIADADVLIVASGVRTYTQTQITNIQAFVEAGKGVYLQSEHLATYGGNVAFAGIMSGLGVNFAWAGEVVGQLAPVSVSGCLAGHDGCVGTLPYFWYAQRGGAAAPGFEAFLHKNGQDIGFSYCPPDPALGAIVTTSDQDFIRTLEITPAAEDLMENMFNRIARPQACKP